MENNIIEKILQEYNSKRKIYKNFTKKLKELIIDLVNDKANIHIINSRVKERASLNAKLDKPESNYNSLAEITDISGIRIITYFENDVDIISDIIENEFKIDWDNSVDRRKIIEPDRFGYLSIHYDPYID